MLRHLLFAGHIIAHAIYGSHPSVPVRMFLCVNEPFYTLTQSSLKHQYQIVLPSPGNVKGAEENSVPTELGK